MDSKMGILLSLITPFNGSVNIPFYFSKKIIKEAIMKFLKGILAVSITVFTLNAGAFAQDLNIHKMIGKTKADVINKYGKPTQLDDSNSSILCMFYKNPNYHFSFVSYEGVVFQASANIGYKNEQSAKEALDNFISSSVKDSMAVDTLSTSNFNVHKTGVSVEIRLISSQSVNKFILCIDAKKSAM